MVKRTFLWWILLSASNVRLVRGSSRDDVERQRRWTASSTSSLYWKRLGYDVWVPPRIPSKNATAYDDDVDDDRRPVPTWDDTNALSALPTSLSLARNNQRVLVLAHGVTHVYELRTDAHRPIRRWYPIHANVPFPMENRSATEGTARVTAAAISPNGGLVARLVVDSAVSADVFPGEGRDRRSHDEDSPLDDHAWAPQSGYADSDADSALRGRVTSTIQVLSIADRVVLGSWTESYHSSSSCLSETRLVMEDRFFLVLCPEWGDRRGRALLFEVFPSPQLVGEWHGDNAGDGLGTAGDVDSTSRDGVVRVALGSPGYVQGTGLVRLYDLVAQGRRGSFDQSTWSARQFNKDLTGITPGDRFGTSVSLSHTGEGTVAIATLKGAIYLVSFERPPQPTSSSLATVVQEIDIPQKYNSRGQDPETELGSYPFDDVTVYLTPDAQRLVVAFETNRNAFVRKSKQVIVYEDSASADSPMRWMQVAHFRLGFSALVTTTGNALAVWSEDQVRLKSDTAPLWGHVRVILDRSPFCSADVSCHVDPFLERKTCRPGRIAASDEAACRAASPSKARDRSCTWIQDTGAFGDVLSTSPTSMGPGPVSNPSAAPVAIQRENPENVTLLSACVCDQSLSCSGEPAATDLDLRVCVLGVPSQYTLKRVTSMYLQQDRIRYSVLSIDGAKVEGVTSECSITVCCVLIPHWKFDLLTKGESNLLAAGTVALAPLSPSKVRRGLGTVFGRGRRASDELVSYQGYFSAVVPLGTTRFEHASPETVPVSYAFWIVLACLLFLAMSCCLCAMRSFAVPIGEGGEQRNLVTS